MNTGWIGGTAASGSIRISIQNTRAMITAILDRSIEQSEFETEPVFGLAFPKSLSGIDSEVLNPRSAWENSEEYDRQAVALAELFSENFTTYGDAVSYLKFAGPLNQNKVAI